MGEPTPASPRSRPTLTRAERRRLARMAPGRRCESCGADLSKVFDIDTHHRHLKLDEGLPIAYGRRLSKFADGAPLTGKLD